MADTRITGLTEQTVLALDDWLESVDKSDTTDDAAGSSRKLAMLTLMQHMPHGLTEISVTGTSTATIGRMYVCSGTSADYTLTLPAASGNTGKIITVRMATGLTKLVTLDGNASETIDGALTRVMWAGESAILLCDGSNWFKIGGKSKPMSGRMARVAALANLTDDAYTAVPLDTSNYDNGGMVDTSNSRFNILRPSLYLCNAILQIDGGSGSGAIDFFGPAIYKSTSTAIADTGITAAAGGYIAVGVSATANLVAGDIVRLRVYHNRASGGSNYGLFVSNPNFLELIEQPQW